MDTVEYLKYIKYKTKYKRAKINQSIKPSIHSSVLHKSSMPNYSTFIVNPVNPINMNNIIEIINSVPDFCEACVGEKTEITMKSVDKQLEPFYPENKRPMFYMLDSLGIAMGQHKVDPLFLRMKEIKSLSQQKSTIITFDFNNCHNNFLNNRNIDNKIHMENQAIKYLIDSTKVYINANDSSEYNITNRIIQMFYNLQLTKNHVVIYYLNILRSCIYNDDNNEMNINILNGIKKK